MTINDVSLRAGGSRPLPSDKSRVEEVQRLAQGAAAAQFVGIPAQLQNGNSSQIDSAAISSEAIEEIARSGNSLELQRTDQLVSALRWAFESSTGQHDSSGSGRAQEPSVSPAAEETTAPSTPAKKRVAPWEPPSQAGVEHPQGRELLGQLLIKADPQERAEAAPSGSRSHEVVSLTSAGHGATVSEPVFAAAKF